MQLRTTSVALGENYMVAEVSTDGNNATIEDTLDDVGPGGLHGLQG
jgi:hypothetical protein